MKLVALVCLCLVTRCGITAAGVNDRVLKDRTGENITGAAPKPSVTSLKDTKYSWRLQCEVHGNPVPKVEWQDSDGNILPAEKPQVSKSGDRYDVILNANVNKTDYYRCVATQETISHQTYVYISGPKVVEDGSDVILPCSLSTKENIQSGLFDWKKDGPRDDREVFLYDAGIHYNNGRSGQSERFKGRVSHFPDQLKNGNASIIIRNTKVNDSGNYACDFPRLQPPQIFRLELIVGAAPKPSVTSLKTTKYWWQLQCEVHGNPEPKVEWQDSDGNILPAEEPQVSERGGSFYIILQVTVTKTDRYRCVVTQETISHQIYAETYVRMNGAASKPSVTILDQTEDEALLQCEIRGASPEPRLQWQDSDGNILPAEERQVSERGGSYDVILQVTVTKTDRYRCVATQETISHQVYTEIYVYINVSESSTGWIVAAVLGAVLFVVVVGVGVLLAVLVYKGCIPINCNKDEEKRRDSLDDPSQQLQVQQP